MQLMLSILLLIINVLLCVLTGFAGSNLISWAFNSPEFLTPLITPLALMLAAIAAYFLFTNGDVIHDVKEQEIWMFWDRIFGALIKATGYSMFIVARSGFFVSLPWWHKATVIPLVKGDKDVDKKVIPLETNQGDSVGVERTISYRPDPNHANTYVQNGGSEEERQKNILLRLVTVVDRIVGQIVTGMPSDDPVNGNGIFQQQGRKNLCDQVRIATNIPPLPGETPDAEFRQLVRELGIRDVQVLIGDPEQTKNTAAARQLRFIGGMVNETARTFTGSGVEATRAHEMAMALVDKVEYRAGRQEIAISGAKDGMVVAIGDTAGAIVGGAASKSGKDKKGEKP